MQQPSILKHLRDIILLPLMVTVVIPYLCYDRHKTLFPEHISWRILGILILLGGLSLFCWTVYLFWAFGKGTLAPWTPTQKLIVRGPYKYCRNPMISGVFFILLGEMLFFNSVNILIIAVVFFLVNTIYFILMEEPGLQKRFGADYEHYKQHVPRWLPRFTAYRAAEV